jgi:hypothetical protein
MARSAGPYCLLRGEIGEHGSDTVDAAELEGKLGGVAAGSGCFQGQVGADGNGQSAQSVGKIRWRWFIGCADRIGEVGYQTVGRAMSMTARTVWR